MGKVAIVLGATGVVGSELVQQLAQHDGIDIVKAVTRRSVNYESSKINNDVVEFDRLSAFASVFEGDMLFSCLGTTRKTAGSIAKQRQVDVDYQLEAATLASKNAVGHYLLVSSSGANRLSLSPYLKMKGELETEIGKLPFQRISIFRPSLLVGNRAVLRVGEAIGNAVMPLICKVPPLRKYRPITGKEVAKKMLKTSLVAGRALEIYKLDEIFT